MLKEIVNHPGYYITESGYVLSTHKHKGHAYCWLKSSKLNHGHLVVSLGNKNKKYLVHRLVLETFIGPCPDNMECCHNNGNPQDNNLSNLRWDTHSNNHKDKIRHGRWINPTKQGEKHPRAILSEQEVRLIINLYKGGGYTHRGLAKQFGVAKTTIGHILNKENWKYLWK